MIKLKTISGHYGSSYNLAHNNRIFIPANVDIERTPNNYNCVIAGQDAFLDPSIQTHISEFWRRYRELNDLYWKEMSAEKVLASKRYQAHLEYMRRFSRPLYPLPHNLVEAFITLLFLPLLIPCELYLNHQHKKAKAEWEQFKDAQWVRNLTYNSARTSMRKALYAHDMKYASSALKIMDSVVSELSTAGPTLDIASIASKSIQPSRFATLEEIYSKLYEPAFREFQANQRPCRRYDGTYLEQIRENKVKSAKSSQQSKNAKLRRTSEAIEIVFCIGDMDNTGYEAAFEDAKKAEEILGDFCDHLMSLPNLCCVTTKELNDPKWKPPFRNGLIVLNLNVHADEATPGVHLTCIPYSGDCNRGPRVQASLGKAMAGMGYPSTWKDVLDENGHRVPKVGKNGETIRNKDGSVRYQQEPDKQGIIDWIEDQKKWIQKEMKRRYDWDREYKGSHPRGNLSTPDYKVARAKERLEECQTRFNQTLYQYENRIYELSTQLDSQVVDQLDNSTNQEIIDKYLAVCSDEEYDRIVQMAANYLDQLARKEQDRARKELAQQIREADEKVVKSNKQFDIENITR